MKNKVTLLILLTTLLTSAFTCKSPTESDGGNTETTDTTSQNFTFDIKEFGDGFSSSYFKDAWIFDENNIWVVGTVQQDSFQGNCNIMRWNGSKWNYVNSGEVSSLSGIYGIWALDSSTIYFGSGAIRRYKEGQFRYENTSTITFSSGQGVYKLWGSSANNIWGVGPKGTVVHYDGITWEKIPCETKYEIQYVNGDPETGTGYSLSYDYNEHNSYLLILHPGSTPWIEFIPANTMGVTDFDETVYMGNNQLMMAATGQIKIYDLKTKSAVSNELTQLIPFEAQFLSWVSAHDFYQWGSELGKDQFSILHYNGIHYQKFPMEIANPGIPGGCYAIRDLAVFTGDAANKGLIVMMKRVKK